MESQSDDSKATFADDVVSLADLQLKFIDVVEETTTADFDQTRHGLFAISNLEL